MEESRRLVVRGFVQGVGYRAFIQMMARRLGIRGRVRNLNDGNVEVIVTGRAENIEKFVKLIEIKAESPFEPDVHRIEIEKYAGSESFDDFRIDYGYDMSVAEKEMIERSEIGILAFGWMGKYLGNKIDTLSEKTDRGFSELGEKIDRSSAESSARLDTVSKNTGELNEKIDKLSTELPDVVEKVDRFREDTIGAFGELDRKYHVISQNLERLNGNIEKMVDDLGILIREFVEEKRRNEGLK